MTSEPANQQTPEQTFKELERQFILVNLKWKIYNQLFTVSHEQIDLLNQAAPTFFAMCQSTFVDDVMLALARLTDPAQSYVRGGASDNLSLEQLLSQFNPILSPELKDKLDKQAASVKTQLDPFKKIRHKRLAHTDLVVALDAAQNPLPNIGIADIDAALRGVSRLLNIIGSHFDPNSETSHTNVIMNDDGKTLIFLLEQAKKYQQLEDEKWNNIGS